MVVCKVLGLWVVCELLAGPRPSSPHRTNRFYPEADLAAALGQESTWENRNPPGPTALTRLGAAGRRWGDLGPAVGAATDPDTGEQ